MNKDVLGEIFKFLGLANVVPVSLVCSEWCQVMDSENLWKNYFNTWCYSKDQLLSESQQEICENYWKNQIKERCTAFYFKLPKRRFIGQQKLNLSISHLHFSPDSNYQRCLFKLLCSRINIDSVKLLSLSGEQELALPFASAQLNSSTTLNFKIRLSIEGLSESIIIRAYNVAKYSKSWQGKNYLLYFALESDDLSNLQYMTIPIVKLNQVKSSKRAFLFEFVNKDKFGLVTGEEYLTERILSRIIPPSFLKSAIDKQEMSSMWCLIMGKVLSSLDVSKLIDHKWVLKFIPLTKTIPREESLVYAFRKGIYRDRANRVAIRVLNNEKYEKMLRKKESELFSPIEELKRQKPEILSLENRSILSTKENCSVVISVDLLKQIRLMLLSDEYMEYYLDYKFGRIKG